MTEIILPGSKSIAARAIILNRVYRLALSLENLPDCDDTRELLYAFRDLDAGGHSFNLGTGGTSLRFFLAYVASLPGFCCTIDCSDELRRRPLAPLIDALGAAGAYIEYLSEEGRAPLRVRGAKLRGLGVKVDCGISSQFASALLMVSDLWESPVEIAESETMVSKPYVRMTRRMIEIFRSLKKEGANSYYIEPDWSAASYFYEYRLLNPQTEFKLVGLQPPGESLQGDSRCEKLFSLPGGNIDMTDTPDLVPALAVGLCCAGIHFNMTGVANLRHKESNRLDAISSEMAKAGYMLTVGEDSLSWHGERCTPVTNIEFDSHDDHRIAMALKAAGFDNIRGAGCVSKSFPQFYSQLAKLSGN